MNEAETIAALGYLREAVRAVRRVYPRMEVGQLEVLLTICTKPGIRGSEILEQMEGITSNSVYRTIKVLSDSEGQAGEGRRQGLDLIAKLPDPSDNRAVLLVPTRRGKQLAAATAEAMKGACDGAAA